MNLSHFLFIGIGGFFGANTRYILSSWVAGRVASFAGLTMAFWDAVSECIRLVFAGGVRVLDGGTFRHAGAYAFAGGFTTFSTYATEGAAMLRSGDYFNGLAYILLTNALCLLAAVFGMWLANN